MFSAFCHTFNKSGHQNSAKRTYSLRNNMILYSLIAGFLFLSVSIFITYYFSDRLLDNTFQNIHPEMNLYRDQLAQNLNAAERGLLMFTENNTQAGLLSTLPSASDTIVNQIRVKESLETIFPYVSSIDGLFIYAPKNDIFISHYTNGSITCSNYLKMLMRGQTDITDFPTEKWCFIPLQDSYYLIRILKSKYCFVGAWAHMDTLTNSFKALKNSGTQFLYIDAEGHAIDTPKWSEHLFSIPESTEETIEIKDREGEAYLQITYPLDFCDYHLIALVPYKNIKQLMQPVYRFILVIFFILLLLCSSMLLVTNHYMTRPLVTIQQLSSKIREQKNALTEIPAITDETCREVIEINSAITALLEEITALQSSVYEEKLLKSEFELQYLKSQISPHFLINCLSTICSISNTKDGGSVTQKMIQTLSDHLRYSLSSKQVVPLSEELYYVENYLELTAIRFPGCLSYSIQVPAECRNATFFPVFLLTLAENTIKVNMIMGELLKIKISGTQVSTENGQVFVHLIYIDSGQGFDENTLVILNDLHNEIKNPTIDGHKIGLYNVVKRMELLYHTKGKLHFSNEPGWGARIDILIPYLPYSGEDSI